jgi:site-specific recombinase XerC
MLHKYVISIKKDTVFRVIQVIDDTRDRAMFQLAYCHGLRPSEIGMIQVKESTRR